MVVMEICQVINFERIDQYIKEKKELTIFEDRIILWLASHLRERELFFLLKDSSFPKNLELLKHIYRRIIGGKYSTHQIARIAVSRKFEEFQYQLSSEIRCQAFSGNEYYPFQEKRDYLTLYEDERVKIIVFLLKMIGIFDGYDGKRHILQNGYYVKQETQNLILPYDTPYDYSYILKEYDKKDALLLREYYREQREQLKRNLKRSIEFDEKLL